MIDFPVTGAEAVAQPLALRADRGGRIPGRRAAGLELGTGQARGRRIWVAGQTPALSSALCSEVT
jgi:hypothetical protein